MSTIKRREGSPLNKLSTNLYSSSLSCIHDLVSFSLGFLSAISVSAVVVIATSQPTFQGYCVEYEDRHGIPPRQHANYIQSCLVTPASSLSSNVMYLLSGNLCERYKTSISEALKLCQIPFCWSMRCPDAIPVQDLQ